MNSSVKYIFIIFFCFCVNSGAQISVGDTAGNFTLPDTSGNLISLQDFSGDVILLNFFASWCVPCSIEAPQLQDSIWNVYRNQNFTLVGVDFQEPLFPLLNFINFYGLTFPIVRDTAGNVFNDYGLMVLPSNVIINQNGIVAWAEIGFDIPVMRGVIDSLLNVTRIPEFISENIPSKIELVSNYPNPFNNRTNIKIKIHQSGSVSVKVFDLNGRIIRQWNQKVNRGNNLIKVHMENVANGVYFYSIGIDNESVKGKFILHK